MTDNHFYKNGPVFTNFEDITEDQYFQPVPGDWTLFMTDVQDSTSAIHDGKYRDVNLIGASTVAIGRNVLGTLEFPFAFGGDGAALCVPPEHDEELRARLTGLQKLANNQFQLDLRVGAIPVAELENRPENLEIARYEITSGVSVAIFRGGGISVADELIKQQPDQYAVSVMNPPEIDLAGLSCRWKPIPCERDHILSLMVRARGASDQQIYQNVLAKLRKLYDGQLQQGNPVNSPGLSYRSVTDCVRDEGRYYVNWNLSYLSRIVEIVLAVLLFRWNVPLIFVSGTNYRNALPYHSDYRKFDDMLRITLDCSTEQVEQIVNYLKDQQQKENLFYGHHVSSEALMTCFVESLNDGEHIHFIDGGDGGYAMAAVQLKRQMQQSGTLQERTEDRSSRSSEA